MVILGEPYFMVSRMERKVLDNGSAYARVNSQDGEHYVQFLTVYTNREQNWDTLKRIFEEGYQGMGPQ